MVKDDIYFIANFVKNETLENGGSTYNLKDGNMAGKELFSVSENKEKEVVLKLEKFDEYSVIQFIETNYEILSNPDYSLGSWISGDLVYLDISRTVTGIENALDIARRNNQEAIYNLYNLEEIRVD